MFKKWCKTEVSLTDTNNATVYWEGPDDDDDDDDDEEWSKYAATSIQTNKEHH